MSKAILLMLFLVAILAAFTDVPLIIKLTVILQNVAIVLISWLNKGK